ncbi:MAG TPA: fused MFS/spermidine synthase [Patescibacteria group bacterium]|nr:fused MFS/spermidine synthase [Patescibacteria group bacterium]
MTSWRGSIWSIRFTVFVSGAVVMALELVGSRLLAPAFGDSIFVWGSLIGVVMTSLAVGYYVGGRLADRDPSYATFSLITLTAGLFTILIPLSSPMILEAVYFSGFGERYGPVLASLLMLGVPTTLLGMVSPYSIKMAAESLVSVGGISGSLSSISTGGSIFGTFFTVFVLIPLFGNRQIVFGLGVVLVLVSLSSFRWRDRAVMLLLILVLMLPSTFIGGVISSRTGTVIYSRETPYSTLTVVDKSVAGVRTLYLNNMPHSSMYMNGSNSAVFPYTDYFNLATLFNPDFESALFIGGGGFSGPKQFLEYYPGVSVDVVEIDPDVVSVALEYFGVPDDPGLGVFVEDGRKFLDGAGLYDVIVLDAYSKTYVPFHLLTLEFFQELTSHLTEDGVIVFNVISSLVGDTSELLMAEYRTIAETMPQIYLFRTRSSSLSKIQNVILIATMSPSRESVSSLVDRAEGLPERGDTLAGYVRTLFDSEGYAGEGLILTDDYAPATSLLNPITQSPYEGGDELIYGNSLNPFIIAGAWFTVFASVYALYSTMRNRG